MLEKEAEAAANWWAKVVCNPKMDNGDRSICGLRTKVMAMSIIQPVSEEQQTKFKERIYDIITRKHIVEYKRQYGDCSMCRIVIPIEDSIDLSVDYHPGWLLQNAFDYAGITHDNAPIKTRMQIKKGIVAVVYGWESGTIRLYDAGADHNRCEICSNLTRQWIKTQQGAEWMPCHKCGRQMPGVYLNDTEYRFGEKTENHSFWEPLRLEEADRWYRVLSFPSTKHGDYTYTKELPWEEYSEWTWFKCSVCNRGEWWRPGNEPYCPNAVWDEKHPDHEERKAAAEKEKQRDVVTQD